MAVAIITAQLATAKTVYKAFVSSTDSGPTEGLLHLFAIDGADMHHERIFLRSYGDGHVRIPVTAVYSRGDVYVLDRGPAGDTTSARILVYSLDGAFQRVLCDDFRDGDHVSSAALPGADKPFAVRYDPVKEVYWAVTTPDNTSIALYASQDLATWKFAQTILTVSDPDTTKVANPAFDFSSKDLVLAFNLACPDGTTEEILTADRPNFTIARKVGDFRKSCPFKKGMMLIFR